MELVLIGIYNLCEFLFLGFVLIRVSVFILNLFVNIELQGKFTDFKKISIEIVRLIGVCYFFCFITYVILYKGITEIKECDVPVIYWFFKALVILSLTQLLWFEKIKKSKIFVLFLGIILFVASVFSDQMINVIGVPIAAWQSMQAWSESSTVSPYDQYMPCILFLTMISVHYVKAILYFIGVLVVFWVIRNKQRR